MEHEREHWERQREPVAQCLSERKEEANKPRCRRTGRQFLVACSLDVEGTASVWGRRAGTRGFGVTNITNMEGCGDDGLTVPQEPWVGFPASGQTGGVTGRSEIEASGRLRYQC